MRLFAWSLFLIDATIVSAQSLYPDKSVLKLNAGNFKEKVLRTDRTTMVEFYAPWCGHCKQLAPEYIQSSKDLAGVVQVGVVNCDLAKNKRLCAHYKVTGFPTIKVFQPAKRTDVEFKDALEGKPLEPISHKVYSYNGERTAKKMNKFAISKLRNYAATLEGDNAFLWLKPNKVPRVLMLTGKKYKGKSISPLFKVLSSEYFGKMRFGVIPRRADGAWELLKIEAPEDSQIVYLSDDRPSVIYQGKITKRSVKAFLNEQYELEMGRRKVNGLPLQPKRSDAAHGLEWVKEDQQESELEHVLAAREEAEENKRVLEENKRKIREKKGIKQPAEHKPATSSSGSIFASKPSSPLESHDIDDSEQYAEFVDDDEDKSSVDEDLTVPDEEYATLDDVEVEWSQDELLDESPEVAAAFKAEQHAKKVADLEARRALASRKAEFLMSRLAKKSGDAFTPSHQTVAGITPAAQGYEALFESRVREQKLQDMDALVSRCLRSSLPCVLLLAEDKQAIDDVRVLVDSRNYLPVSAKDKIIMQYFVEDSDELTEAARDLAYIKSTQEGDLHQARVGIFDYKKQDYYLMEEEFTAINIAEFVSKFLKRKTNGLETQRIPKKYALWVTEDDVEFMDSEERLRQEQKEMQQSEQASEKEDL